MIRLLSKLLNIRPAEWPSVLILYGMAFVVTTGIVWGETIAEAAFLQQVGVGALPWFFMVKALLSIPAVAIYTAFVDRAANDKILIAILIVSVLGITAGLALLRLNQPYLAYPLLYLLVYVPMADIFAAHWYTYVNGFYDTRAAKRIVPVLGTAVGLASIVAGLTMPVLNRYLAPSGIVVIWLTTLLITAAITWLAPYVLKKSRVTSEQAVSVSDEAGADRSYLLNLREGYRYVLNATYLRWLALAALLLTLLLTFLQYQTSQILLNELKTVENIANFTGRLTGLANLIMLPLQLILLGRIIGRLGLGNAYLIFPAGTLAISGGLIARPNLITAALAYLDRGVFYANLGYPLDSLLYNAVPIRVKGRARAFINGLIMPLGSAVAGLLLLLPLITTTWLLAAAIGLLAAGFMANALVIRRHYGLALIELLEQEDYSFLLSGGSALSMADPATLNGLKKKLEESTNPNFSLFMAQLITQVGSYQAVPIIGQAARSTADPHFRAALLDVLTAAGLQGETLRQLYISFLTDPDGEVRQAALNGLESLAEPQDKAFLALAFTMLTDPDSEVRARVLPALLKSVQPGHQAGAMKVLNEFLENQDPLQRVSGVRVLQRAGEARLNELLVKFLADPADEVRVEAAITVEERIKDKNNWPATLLSLDQVNLLLHDRVQRIRQAALVILGQIGTHSSHQLLVSVLTDSSPEVRAAAVDALVEVGKAAIPTIHPKLDSSDPQLRKMAAVILSRINRRDYVPLVMSYITGNLLGIYSNYNRLGALSACQDSVGVGLVQSALREQNRALLEEIFYLLSAVHPPDTIKVIQESLQSEVNHVQVNALEALETLVGPDTVRLVAPLFEREPAPAQLREISQETWVMEPLTLRSAVTELVEDTSQPWFRALTLFALSEMATPLVIPSPAEASQPAESPEPEKKSRPTGLDALLDGDNGGQKERPARRRPRPADLLGSLLGSPEEVAPSSPPPASPVPAVGNQSPFSMAEIVAFLDQGLADHDPEVRATAQAARQRLDRQQGTSLAGKETTLLSTIEKIIFLKQIPFFQNMTVNQLRALAEVCEEESFAENTRIFNEKDVGGTLYIIVSGRVGIEQEKRRDSFVRLATLGAYSYFGEMTLFDNGPRSASAITLQDTLTLRLRREPVIALARQYPDISLELIKVLNARLREAGQRVTELTRGRPRELHKLFDQFDE